VTGRGDELDQLVQLQRVRALTDSWRHEPSPEAVAVAPRLLADLAEALNACEAAGLIVALAEGAAITKAGYVLTVGDPQICGERYEPRTPWLTEFPKET
jgi:hypothetical protein